MQKVLQDEMEQRYLFVNENQMINIPYELGITGTVFTKRKSVYFNEFEGSAFYVEEADNMKTLDKITSKTLLIRF